MKHLVGYAALILLIGCAHGKMGTVTQPLDRAAYSKTTKFYIYPVTTNDIRFTGDKADDEKRTTEEKEEIGHRYHRMIITDLRKKGFNAALAEGKIKSGMLVKGNVRKFEHGSGAARALVGFGAGSSNMFTDFKVIDAASKKTVGNFEVIATSGGRAGLASMGSFLDAHLIDGAEKFSEYVSGEEK